jgi:hypothetical protein
VPAWFAGWYGALRVGGYLPNGRCAARGDGGGWQGPVAFLEVPLPTTVVPLRFAALPLIAAGVLLTAGCTIDAKDARPQHRTFPFSGTTLNVVAHGTPTDLVPADRRDVRVTRWFVHKPGSSPHAHWRLAGHTLDIDAGCTGLALCDVRFQVDVPRGVRVLRDGRATKLTGGH